MSMFGALNRFIARLDADPADEPAKQQEVYGFQVLRNTNTEIPIEPWFDFVIGINGRNIDNGDSNLFTTEVRNCAGSRVELGLWSAKGQRSRSIYVSVPPGEPGLGLSLQWNPLNATDDTWHILDVTANSPADLAGLLPYGDYIIGSPEGLLKGETALGELVEDYLSKPLRLYVYNHEYNVTRLVTIEPSRTWGGTGALGCVLGYGALHKIPAPLDEPPQGPGETMFETADMNTDAQEGFDGGTQAQLAQPSGQEEAPQYLVPANMNMGQPKAQTAAEGATAAPPKSSGTGTGRRNRAHPKTHSHAAMDMDAYFQEGEAKSKEQDGPASSKSAGSIAPPPKAGASKPQEASGADG